MPFFVLNQILVVVINAIAILIGLFVYRDDPKGKNNRILVLMAFLMLLWVNFAFLARLLGREDPDLAISFLRIAWFATPLLFTSLYFLVISLIDKGKKYEILNKAVLVCGIFSAFITGFTEWIVAGTEFIGSYLAIDYGSGMMPFLTLITFLIIATLYPLFKEYPSLPAIRRHKIQYLFVGIFIFYVANFIFNISLPVFFETVRFYWIGDYSTIFLLGFIGYAIVSKELFNVKVVLTQTFVLLIAILLLVQSVIASDLPDFLWSLALFIIFLIFGYFLIKSVIREIEQRERLEKLAFALEQANVELKQMDKAKSEFVSIASHQLRTPLTAIKGYLSMMTEGTYGKVPPKIREKMKNVAESNDRLIRLVNELLSLSRIETGKIKLEPEKLKLENVVKQVVKDLRIVSKKNGLYLRFSKPKKALPEMMIDEWKIRQSLINIIDNALKYTGKGGVTVTVRKEEGNAKIEICDTGEGMEEDELKKMFDSFSRGQAGNRLSSEGAGLGLYIARKFVEMHEGKIWAESEGRGKGSCFHILVPIKRS